MLKKKLIFLFITVILTSIFIAGCVNNYEPSSEDYKIRDEVVVDRVEWIQDLKLEEGWGWKHTGGYVILAGTLVNKGGIYSFLELRATFYDKKGVIIAREFIILRDFGPEEKRYIEFMSFIGDKTVYNVTFRITESSIW